MAFKPIFDIAVDELATPRPKKTSLKNLKRGCAECPSNDKPGVKKIIEEIHGRAIWIVAQSPGPEENKKSVELIGPSGEFWWKELGAVGITRKDCDISNSMRCFPCDVTEGSYSTYLKMRSPNKEELHCCSLHTDKAVEKSKAKQILILGQVAAKAFLKVRSLPPNKIFWSDEHHAKIYLLDHPSFFIRGYGKGPRMDTFRTTLNQVAKDKKILEGKDANLSDEYAYLRKQDLRLVITEAQALKAERIIRKYAKKKRRVAVDIEDDDFKGTRRVFACGFAPKATLAFTFVWRHKEIDKNEASKVKAVAARLLEDETVRKAMQYGCSDVSKLLDLEEITVRGYDHDTNLSEYLRFSDKKAYGLEAIAEQRFPEFSGYKLIVVPELMNPAQRKLEREEPDKKLPKIFTSDLSAQSKWLSKTNQYHLRYLSLETLRLYNGGDSILTKRIEIDNKKHVPQALMSLYIDLSFLLYDMEPNGPLFDYEQHDKLYSLYPAKEKQLRRRLCKMLDDQNFNPGSPDQVYGALYGTLGLEYPFDGQPNTRKATLLMLGRESKFARLMLEWRSASKVQSILEGYKRSADANSGRLRTRWWSTGTRTGRLSSGGGKDRKTSSIINLQNIKKDAQVQDMCVADVRWKKFFDAAQSILRPMHELREYWRACARIERANKKLPLDEHKKLPKASVGVKALNQQAGLLLEKWVRRECPDLCTFLILDYGQIEVRVMAQMCGDKNLIADCQESDIHTRVGVQMTGWDAERIRNDEATRTLTKNCIAEGQRVLTNYGLVPIEQVTKDMLVWDGIEFVNHDGVICQGVREIITYRGLSATPDHEVWTAFGKQRLGYVAQSGLELVVTGDDERPIRYAQGGVECIYAQEISTCASSMPEMRTAFQCICRSYTQRYFSQLYVSTQSKISRWACGSFTRTLFSNATAVRKSRQSELAQLRWARDKEQVQVLCGVRRVRTSGATTSQLQGSRDRQEKQRRPLRAGQPSLGYKSRQREEQKKQRSRDIQRREDDSYRSCSFVKKQVPRYHLESAKGTQIALCRHSLEEADQLQASGTVQKVKVYDIVNAGPRRRFTVEGYLVSNCHFGIMYGLSKAGLYKFVVAMSPPDMRGRITEQQVSRAYDRYFKRYKKVRRFHEAQRAFAKENHFTKTIFGMIQTLNVTDDTPRDEEFEQGDEEYADSNEMGGRGAYWGNQAVNSPVQGSAHQLMICALVNLRRKVKKYSLLGIPPMEVHDALYFGVPVLSLIKAFSSSKYLLEKESLTTVTSDFPEIGKWKVPIVVEAKAGLRLGCKVKVTEKTTIGGFLLEWVRRNAEQVRALDKELEAVA